MFSQVVSASSVLFPKRSCPSTLTASLWACSALARGMHYLGVSRKALPTVLSVVGEPKQSSRNLNTVPSKSFTTLNLTHSISWKYDSFPRRPYHMEQQVFGQPGWMHSLTPRRQDNIAQGMNSHLCGFALTSVKWGETPGPLILHQVGVSMEVIEKLQHLKFDCMVHYSR